MFERIAKNIAAIPAQLTKVGLKSLKDHDHLVIDYITEVQLFEKGEDGQGKKLRSGITGSENYAPFTIDEKKAKGQPTDHFTLKDEGDYYASHKLSTLGLVTADSQKPEQDLAETFGPDIKTLSFDGMGVMIDDFLLEDVQDFVRKQLLK